MYNSNIKHNEEHTLNKKLLITLPIVALLLLAGYFFVIPAMAVNDYKPKVAQSHLSLTSSIDKAINAARQNAFIASDITVAEAKNAINVSKDAASDLEVKIQSNEKALTSLSEVPFGAAVSSSYKRAQEVKSLEQQHLKAAKDYLAELKLVNDYNEKTVPIIEIMDQLKITAAEMESAESPEEILKAIDTYTTKLSAVEKIASPLTPAESLKKIHERNLKNVRESLSLMKQMKAAVIAMDVEKIMSLLETYQKLSAVSENEMKKLANEYVEESKLANLGKTVTELKSQIDTKTAEL